MKSFQLSIISPRGKAFEGEAELVVLPARDGRMGVMAHHAPLLTTLKAGEIRVVRGTATDRFNAGEGLVEVCDNEVSVLVDHAEETAGDPRED